MSDFLKSMAASSAERAAAIRADFRSADFDSPVIPLTLDGFDLIAEIKERSPTEGSLVRAASDRGERARQYVQGGAAAISVLTEPLKFAGALEHLREVVAAVSEAPVPVMRKDFLVHPRQIEEARAAGASGVLLIVAMLSERQLAGLLDCAFDHSLFVLLESFDEKDLARASKLLRDERYGACAAGGQLLFGINARNLRSLAVEPRRFESLASMLPERAVGVAESGLLNAGDAMEVAALGYRMALIGTALMRASDPVELIRHMLAAGRKRIAA